MPVEYLDPEIANEGEVAIEDFRPMMDPPRIPNYDGIKSIKHYFPEKSGRPYVASMHPYPAWIYHPTKEAIIVQDARHAKRYGVVYRECSKDERAQGFPSHRYEYSGDWRATPFHEGKPDPHSSGKSIIHGRSEHGALTQSEMINAAVSAAVAAALAAVKGVGIPAVAGAIVASAPNVLATAPAASLDSAVASGELSNDEEREILLGLAAEKGVKVDRRWGIDKIKAALDAVAPENVG